MRSHRSVWIAVTLAAVATLFVISPSISASARVYSAPAASAGVALARHLVAKELNPPNWTGPTAAFKGSKARGKKVFFINLTEEIPALHEWGVVMAQQLKLLGVSTTDCDAKGTVVGITTCLQQGLASKPDVLLPLALDTAFIGHYISQAHASGIKVITGQTGFPGYPKVPGDSAEVTFDYPQVGRDMGDWFAADSSCKSSPQIITTTSSRQPSLAEVAGMTHEIHKLCPHLYLYPVQNVLIPDWSTKLPTLTRSLLLAHSKLRYLLPLYDGMTIPMIPAIKAMHLNRSIKVAAFNATPVVMQTELSKHTPLAADVGGPNQWYGYALADQVLRVLTGTRPVANEHIPLRLFTRSNIRSINISADESTWYGKVNFRCRYHKLWKIKC